MENTNTKIQFARIGNGAKVHPVTIQERAGFDGKLRSVLSFSCGCPGTQSGSAHARAMIVRGATQATCGN